MKECPVDPNSVNCGLILAQKLVSERAIIIDPFDDFGEPVRIRQDYLNELELLIPGDMRLDESGQVVDFVCTACLKAVHILDSRAEGMRAVLAEE